jgi:ribose transport system substrate-binding protein
MHRTTGRPRAGKWLGALAVLTVGLVTLAACGARGGASSGPAPTGSGGASSAPAQAGSSGASSAPQAASSAAKSYRIGFVNGNTIEFHNCLERGVRKAAEQLGVDLVIVNSRASADQEISNVEDLIVKRVDAIMLQTINIDAGLGAVSRANEAKIPIFLTSVNFVRDESQILGAVIFDAKGEGYLLGDWVAKAVQRSGSPRAKVGIIGGYPGAAADIFSAGFKEGLASAPEAQIVFEQPANFQRSMAQSVAENMVQSHPDMEYVFVHNEDMAFGVLEALRAANKAGSVKIVTQNGTEAGLDAVKKGDFALTMSVSPAALGRLAVESIVKLLRGEPVPKVQVMQDVVITPDNTDKAISYCD